MIDTEDDLWRLFGGEGPDTPGEKELTFQEIFEQTTFLDVGSKGKKGLFRLRFKTTDRGRHYKLQCSDAEAVVDQARLYVMANKMGGPELTVAYLGQSEVDPARPAPCSRKSTAPTEDCTEI